MKVMVATSAGGHWVQMRRLLPAFAGCELVFAGVGRRLDPDLGPARYYPVAQRQPQRTRSACSSSPGSSRRLVRRERPDVVVTTGAAPGLMALAVGQAPRRQPHGLDRLDRQHRAAVAVGPAGAAGGRRLAGAVAAPRPARRPRVLGGGAVIFVTVGGELPFDRLIRAMDAFAAAQPRGEVLAQIGAGGFEPAHMRWVRSLDRATTTPRRWPAAELLVAHAGIGSVVTAGEHGKPIVLLPRQARLGEHRNDHQLDTAALARRPARHPRGRRRGRAAGPHRRGARAGAAAPRDRRHAPARLPRPAARLRAGRRV